MAISAAAVHACATVCGGEIGREGGGRRGRDVPDRSRAVAAHEGAWEEAATGEQPSRGPGAKSKPGPTFCRDGNETDGIKSWFRFSNFASCWNGFLQVCFVFLARNLNSTSW